ncbi:class I SAM-dependent methyltransferase [Agromyces bauzanensis]
MTWFDDFADEMYGGSRPGVARTLAPVLINRLGLTANSIVLDLCCGRGHFSMAASDLVGRVVAVDSALTMIDFLRAQGQPSITAILGDAATEDLRGLNADACVILWNSLGYAGRESDVGLLKNARSALAPDARLVVELRLLEDIDDLSPRATAERRESGSFVRGRSVSKQWMHTVWSVTDPSGKILKRAEFDQYLYTADEFREVLHDAGFVPDAVERLSIGDLGQAQSTFFFARPKPLD